ncbi:hypothetical protein lerEdw1_002989 [Lerista edwardsae]|nr:hypothetical protein lerEdw1_002989 [Lerista edwardsae]
MEEAELGDVESLPRGGFRCSLCHVTVANKPSLEDHLRGKKHQRLENLRSVRQAQEFRSVFVSGFRKGTPASELSEYFQAYGQVVNVVMDKDKGVYAIVELQDREVLEKVLAQPQHSLGGSKLRVKPREKKDFRYAPPRKQGSARLEQLSPEKLAPRLCQVEDVDAQMALVVQQLEFSEGERRLRDLLVSLFREVFLEFFPGSAVLPFGSSVNGFDVCGCDLDLFLDLEKTKNFQASAKGSSEPQVSMEHGEHRGMEAEGRASPELDSRSEDSILSDIDLASATVPEVLELVAAVLRKCIPGVHHVQAVPNARRPVVKFCHKESGLRGDISIDNKLALCNTRFLQLCTEADERVRPLVYAVRYWAKQQALAGNPFGGGPLLNNYALTLLVVYFLQTCSPPILPTVARLRALAEDGEKTVVDSWDCTFPEDSSRLEPSGNMESLCSLLAEFFRVFGDFDFAGSVISLRDGRPLPLPQFLSSGDERRLKLGPFNLQDPFELSHNVAANVNEKTALRFQRCCRDAAKYCRSLQYQRKSSKGKSWGLAHERPGQPGGSPQRGFQEVCDSLAFVFRDVLKCSFSERPEEEPAADGAQQGEEPTAMEVEAVAVGSKRPLAEGGGALGPPPKKLCADAAPPTPESRSWDCTVWHRVWLGRRRVRRQLRGPQPDPPEQADSLGLEVKVSEALSQQLGDARPTAPLLRFAVCAQTGGGQDSRLSLSFAPAPEQAAAFQEFFRFLQGFLPRMVELQLASRA